MTTLTAALARESRIALLDGPTPLRRLGTVGDGITLWVKQDDQGSLGGGGSKLRKLEFIAGAAVAAGADTLVTGGAIQSNHARLTAATAAFLGLRCELLLPNIAGIEGATYSRSGNRLLDTVFNAVVHTPPSDMDLAEALEERVLSLRQAGRAPFLVPFGGSDMTGCLGSLAGALELIEQWPHETPPDAVYLACGSGGMHAGILTALSVIWPTTSVVGISILNPADVARSRVSELAEATAAQLGVPAPRDVTIDAAHIGAGYGALTEGGVAAMRWIGARYGLVLDPVYTSKAMAGFLDHLARGRYQPGANVVFVHSGGLPGVFAYAEKLHTALSSATDILEDA